MRQLGSLNFDLGSVRAAFGSVVADLREKRLWPVAALLLAAIVAVPVVLSQSSAPATPVAQAPVLPGTSGAAAASAVPAVSVAATPPHVHLPAKARDPFTPTAHVTTTPASGSTGQGTGATVAPSSSGSGAGSGAHATTVSGGSASTGGASHATGTQVTGPGASGAPAAQPAPRPLPPASHRPPVTGLTPTQSYRVALAMTNSRGGFDTTDPLERLSALPSAQAPLLVNLGVLKGGRKVLFAVEPGTIVSGPGSCTPAPGDCQILALASGQVENLGWMSANGPLGVGQFSVTDISADGHGSRGAAARARTTASATGRGLLAGALGGDLSLRNALSLFQYNPSLGAVVDLRDVSVGGN